jgi:hypothetical protein
MMMYNHAFIALHLEISYCGLALAVEEDLILLLRMICLQIIQGLT